MGRWICPWCEREFGRRHQAHVCVPAGEVDLPPAQRAIYDEVTAFLATLGPVHVDAVRVGVFLKRDRKLAELRPKARWLSLELMLPRRLDHPRVTRTIRVSNDYTVNVIRLAVVEDVDDEVRGWLAEAFVASGG